MSDLSNQQQQILRHAKITGKTLNLRGKVDNAAADIFFATDEDVRSAIKWIDVQRVERIFPNGILPIAADLLRLGVRAKIRYGNNAAVQEEFCKRGWSDLLTTGISQADPRQTHRVVRYTSNAELYDYLNSCIKEVMQRCKCEKDVIKAFEWSLNEILGNVITHSESPIGGLAQLSVFSKQHRLAFTVVDAGIGFRGSLGKRYPDIRDDSSAIRLAITKGVTRDTGVGQGNGLWGTTEIVKASKGFMDIRTGQGIYIISGDYITDGETSFYRGTSIDWQVPTDSSLVLQNVLQAQYDVVSLPFEKYEKLDGEALLKLAEESKNFGNREIGKRMRNLLFNLVQQSQAHRCVVDFGNVRVISSSFADEFLGKAAVVYGKNFKHVVRITKISKDNERILEMAIRERLAVDGSDARG